MEKAQGLSVCVRTRAFTPRLKSCLIQSKKPVASLIWTSLPRYRMIQSPKQRQVTRRLRPQDRKARADDSGSDLEKFSFQY
jgi:hypothetical protein